jgi:hypothetical protein
LEDLRQSSGKALLQAPEVLTSDAEPISAGSLKELFEG